MSAVFFGNSFTSGENNNNISFANYCQDLLGDRVYNFGVSGTTIGEYSIYPTDGYSLLSMIAKNESKIIEADKIFIQYGANDVTSIMCGFATDKQVIISFVKALDYLKQLNSKAPIYFLATSLNPDIILKLANNTCNYLKNDYFKEFEIDIPAKMWANTYKVLMQIIANRMLTIEMIKDETFFNTYISDDNIHPDNNGHKIIAENIMKQL